MKGFFKQRSSSFQEPHHNPFLKILQKATIIIYGEYPESGSGHTLPICKVRANPV